MNLDTITWFDLYQRAEHKKHFAEQKRAEGVFGIAIEKDIFAKIWQRVDRQSRKFEGRLRASLGQNYYKNRCGRCGYMRYTEACCKELDSQSLQTRESGEG